MMKLIIIVEKYYLVFISMGSNSLKFLDKYDSKYNKVASAMLVDEVFLKEVAKEKHTFISTEMSNLV